MPLSHNDATLAAPTCVTFVRQHPFRERIDSLDISRLSGCRSFPSHCTASQWRCQMSETLSMQFAPSSGAGPTSAKPSRSAMSGSRRTAELFCCNRFVWKALIMFSNESRATALILSGDALPLGACVLYVLHGVKRALPLLPEMGVGIAYGGAGDLDHAREGLVQLQDEEDRAGHREGGNQQRDHHGRIARREQAEAGEERH